MSASGCRTVVSGGETQRAAGRVVEPHDGQVLRDPQSPPAGRFVDPERLLIAASEDRGGRLGQVQQLTAAAEAAFVLEVPVPYQQPVELAAAPFERRPVAIDPRPAAQVLGRAGDHPDVAVPQAHQMIGRGEATGPVRGADARQVGSWQVDRVHDDERDVLVAKLA
jgi:hypothetical protein